MWSLVSFYTGWNWALVSVTITCGWPPLFFFHFQLADLFLMLKFSSLKGIGASRDGNMFGLYFQTVSPPRPPPPSYFEGTSVGNKKYSTQFSIATVSKVFFISIGLFFFLLDVPLYTSAPPPPHLVAGVSFRRTWKGKLDILNHLDSEWCRSVCCWARALPRTCSQQNSASSEVSQVNLFFFFVAFGHV